MALNLNALAPVLEHPPVTPMKRTRHSRSGANEDEFRDLHQGRREKMIEKWRENQRQFLKKNFKRQLDVL